MGILFQISVQRCFVSLVFRLLGGTRRDNSKMVMQTKVFVQVHNIITLKPRTSKANEQETS